MTLLVLSGKAKKIEGVLDNCLGCSPWSTLGRVYLECAQVELLAQRSITWSRVFKDGAVYGIFVVQCREKESLWRSNSSCPWDRFALSAFNDVTYGGLAMVK